MKTAKFTLCADDFGLKRSINQAVIELVETGRINAVSCMSGESQFEAGISSLLEVIDNQAPSVKIGLHLTLTEYSPLSAMPRVAPDNQLPSINRLLVESHLGRLPLSEIAAEVKAQFARFEEFVGRPPDFVDGHQHVHLLPQVRSALVDLLSMRNFQGFVRHCDCRFQKPQTVKTKLLSFLSNRLKKRLDVASIDHNQGFWGINEFDASEDFGALMRGWMKQLSHKGGWSVVMCHPGHQHETDEQTIHDPISVRRVDEWTYLSSDQFIDDLNTAGLFIA